MKLFNEDCLKRLKEIETESVDLVVTDPPYKLTPRGNGSSSGGMFQKKQVNSGLVFKQNAVNIEDWIDEVYRVLKPNSHCYIMTNNRNIYHFLDVIDKSKFHFIKNLIWFKDNKITSQSYMSQFEYIIMCRKGGHRKINDCGTSDVLSFANKKVTRDEANKAIHDTEKPVGLMKVLVENSSNENDVVLDPFMGVGSTGVACKELNRDFIGIEVDESYFNVAETRLK